MLHLTIPDLLSKFPDSKVKQREACAQLHHLVNTLGLPPGCEAAQAIRAQFPELFHIKPPRHGDLPPDLAELYEYLEDSPPRPAFAIAEDLGITSVQGRCRLSRLRRAGLVRKIPGPSGSYTWTII